MAGPGRMRGDGRKAANPGKTLLRLLSYMKKYIPLLVFVFLCIIATSVAQAQGSRALGPLVDDYILPMVANGSTDFGPLKAYLVKLACIFGFGILGTFLFNYLMVGVTQGVQKIIRDDLFAKMQRLPLRYFDSHAAGDIMSRYTSDIDTLRQVISQSIPQCVSSAVTLVVVLWNLIDTSWILTLVMFFTVGLIIYVTKVLAGKSAGFFIGQQRALGTVNGYIEEMISGQKVVKIFNHEEVCKEDFDKLNEELRVNAYSAGKFSNMLGPINNNLGYVQYAVLAVVGGLLCVSSGSSLLTLGNLMAFMVLSRSFNMPISQISNQINAIVMALAGAERIFALMDEEPEQDEGYVTLVNAHVDPDGTIHECLEHTGHWAWKYPHQTDGTVTYTIQLTERADITQRRTQDAPIYGVGARFATVLPFDAATGQVFPSLTEDWTPHRAYTVQMTATVDGKTYEMPINRDTTWQVESADGDVAATEQVDDLPGYGMPGLILRAAYVKQQTIRIKAPAAANLGLLVCTAPYDGYTKGDYENTHPVQALADTPDFAGYDKYWYFDLNELTKE